MHFQNLKARSDRAHLSSAGPCSMVSRHYDPYLPSVAQGPESWRPAAEWQRQSRSSGPVLPASPGTGPLDPDHPHKLTAGLDAFLAKKARTQDVGAAPAAQVQEHKQRTAAVLLCIFHFPISHHVKPQPNSPPTTAKLSPLWTKHL